MCDRCGDQTWKDMLIKEGLMLLLGRVGLTAFSFTSQLKYHSHHQCVSFMLYCEGLPPLPLLLFQCFTYLSAIEALLLQPGSPHNGIRTLSDLHVKQTSPMGKPIIWAKHRQVRTSGLQCHPSCHHKSPVLPSTLLKPLLINADAMQPLSSAS